MVVFAEPVGQVAQCLALAERGQADGPVPAGRCGGRTLGCAVVTRTWQAGPCGHSPSASAGSARPSSTTSQRRPVVASQARNRAAAASGWPGAAATLMSASAWAQPVTILSRLPAASQTSRSSWSVAHRRAANAAARWVLPGPPGPRQAGSAGPTITVVPGCRASHGPWPVSGRWGQPRSVNGTVPDLTGQTVRRAWPPAWLAGRDPAGRPGRGSARLLRRGAVCSLTEQLLQVGQVLVGRGAEPGRGEQRSKQGGGAAEQEPD